MLMLTDTNYTCNAGIVQEVVPACSCFIAIVMGPWTSIGLNLPNCDCYLQHLHGISCVPSICPNLECQKNMLGLGFQLKANANDDPEYPDLNKRSREYANKSKLEVKGSCFLGYFHHKSTSWSLTRPQCPQLQILGFYQS